MIVCRTRRRAALGSALAAFVALAVLGCDGDTGGGSNAKPSSPPPPPQNAPNEQTLLNKLAINSHDVQAHLALANLYYDTDRPHRAIPHYREVLDHRPKDSNVRTDLGTCYKRIGDLDKARQEYEHVLREEPDFAPAAFNLGIVTDLGGKPLQAAEYYERAAAMRPGTPLARRALQFAVDARHRAAKASATQPATQPKETPAP